MPTSFTNSTLNNENRQNSTTSHHNSGIYVAIFIAAMIALIFFVLYFIHWKYKSILTLVENQLCKGEDSYNKPFKREKFKRSPTSSTISKTSASSKKSSSSFSSPIYNGEIYSHHNRRLSGSKQKFFEDSAAAPSTSSPLRSSSDSKSSFNWPKETAHNYSSNSFEEYSQTFLSSANARNTDNRRSVNSEKDNVIQVTLNGEESRGIEGFDTRYSINYEENDDTKNLKNNLKKIITRPKDYHKNYETVERSVSYVNLHRRSQSSPNILFNKNYKNYQNHSTTMVMTEEKEEDFYYFNNRNKNPNCLSVSEEFVGADQLDNQNISRCPSISPTPPGYLRSPIDTISFKDQQGKQTNIREQNRQKDNNSEETKNETKVEENGRFGQHRPSYLGRGDSYFWKTSPRS
ncbi:hypothetical protein BY996DRAFT_2301467 [Phakopsora pachyrhizi]|nr:hypothetical protein BY996DRAFT_2301467 [Phakopsora pachyrhizi]